MQIRAPKGPLLKNQTDIKIFVLFLLNHVRYPLTLDEITDCVTADSVVEHIDFTAAFSELLEQEHVIKGTEGGQEMYMISPKGMETSANLEDSLLASLRKRSLQMAMRHLSLRRREAVATAEVRPLEDGRYTVSCRATCRDGAEIASFSLTIASYEVAEQIRRHFTEQPEEVIRGLTATATGEISFLLSSYEG